MSVVYCYFDMDIERIDKAHTPDYTGLDNCVINPASPPADLENYKIVSSAFVALSDAEKRRKFTVPPSGDARDRRKIRSLEGEEQTQAMLAYMIKNGVTI